jgi:hypothetical protein
MCTTIKIAKALIANLTKKCVIWTPFFLSLDYVTPPPKTVQLVFGKLTPARANISYNYILPLLDEICNWLCTEEAEKLYQELAMIA